MLQFYSTNNKKHLVGLQEAIFKGLAPDNGLYMPTEIKKLDNKFLSAINTLTLQEIAYAISKNFLQDYLSLNDIQDIVEEAINFPLQLKTIEENISALELFHGPTCAFKDFGARFMSRLMKKMIHAQDKELHILVATSGDTGSAVANGFYEVEGIKVIILYPSKKVSHIQEQQLTTLGKNITAIEIEGTFDDCQQLVKQSFLDADIKKKISLTSANSINISRLIPQSFYYAWATAQQIKSPIIVSVPSGNYGNLTAGVIAQKMGFNIDKFIASTNINDIVPQYLKTGIFNPKESIPTISNAMDVGNPSNFIRLFTLMNNDLTQMQQNISGYSFDDQTTKKCILDIYKKSNYLLDPHGAVAYLGVKKEQKNRAGNYVFLETAHPSKFSDVIEPITNQKIEIPQELQSCLTKIKHSILMDTSFNNFKSFLLNL